MRTFVLIAVGNLLRQALTFIAQIVIAGRVGSTMFGELTFAFSLYYLAAAAGDVGARLYGWRLLLGTQGHRKDMVATTFFIRRLLYAVFIALLINIPLSFLPDSSLKLLLQLYSIGIAFNQVTFDWLFLGMEKPMKLFLFHAIGGGIYCLGVLAAVQSPTDAAYVPIFFAASYLLPGSLLVWGLPWSKVSRRLWKRLLSKPSALLSLPKRTWRLGSYDVLQRLYSIYPLIFGWFGYSARVIGEFRVAHLVFSLAVSLSIYFASSLFGRVFRETTTDGKSRHIGFGIVLLVGLTLPTSLVGYDASVELLHRTLTEGYGDYASSLRILIGCSVIVAVSNYLREILISTNDARLASSSYLLTIVSASVLLLVRVDNTPQWIAFSVISGEVVGLLWLILRTSKLEISSVFRSVLLGAMLMAVVLLETWRLAIGLPEMASLIRLIFAITVTSAVYLVYAWILYRKLGSSFQALLAKPE